MPRPGRARGVAQAWIELVAADPEAWSALSVARARLPAARALESLRRWRLVELSGLLSGAVELAACLHRSTQFYNPNKERCTIRLAPGDPTPVRAGEVPLLVRERDGGRRRPAERWWAHETGEAVVVREAVAWAVGFAAGAEGGVEELAVLRDRRHGLLGNPFSQITSLPGNDIPLPWITSGSEPGDEEEAC